MANCIIKARCGNCKSTWVTYWRNARGENANVCPYCGEEIDREIWERDVIGAAAAALDCNMELERYAAGYNKTGFSMDFIYSKNGENRKESEA